MADPIEDDKPFDPEGSGYDMKTARLAGLKAKPQPDDDNRPHWPSRDPETGLLLKGRAHPTFDLGVEHDRREGYGLEMKNGRYYSQPFAQGGPVLNNDSYRKAVDNGRQRIRKQG